eukprot:gene6209-6445_t
MRPVYRLPSKVKTTRSPRNWAVGVIKSHNRDKDPASSLTVKDVLLQCIVGQRFGAECNQEHQKEILELISDWQLRHTAEARGDSSSGAPSSSSCAPTEGPLDGDWRLLWTTEKSVHQIVKGQLLAPVSDIQQHIDLRQKRVTNRIMFGWLGLMLQASGPLTVLSSSRLYYSFDELQLRFAGLHVSLPLFFKGGGWTDCVVGMDGVRVMKNSKNDTLILIKLDHELPTGAP